MNALNPLPLWSILAGVGIAVPVIVHLLNKARLKKVKWAALELLQQTSQQRARKIKLEDWLLMVLRCLTLLFAALAMMRLVFTNDGKLFSGAPRELILAVDASYSMNHGQFESRFDLAKKHALKAVESLPPGSQFSMVTLGNQPEVLVRHSEPDLDVLKRRLDSLEVQPVGLSLDACLPTIESLLQEADLANKEVLILTDAQKQSWSEFPKATIDKFNALQELASTSVIPLWDGSSENLSVSGLQIVSGVRREGGFVSLSVTVSNHGQRPASTSLDLTHNGKVVDVITVGPIEPGEDQLVRLGSQLDQAGANRFKVSIDSDSLPEDNSAYLAIDVPEQLKVLIIEGRDREARYLELALQLQRSGFAQGLNRTTFASSLVQPQDIDGADIIVLANVGDLSDEAIESLRHQVLEGAGLLLYAGDQVDEFSAERILGPLVELKWGALVVPDSGERHQLQVPANPHRISQELGRLDAELSDCIVQGYHELEAAPEANILLALSNGKPLLLTQSVGKGNVAIFATGPGRKWSTLPLNPAGPILFHLLLDELSSSGILRSFEVGESMALEVPTANVGAELKLIHPGGQTSVPKRLDESKADRDILLTLGESQEFGFYELDLGGHGGVEVLAVNVNPLESATQPATVEELKTALAGTSVQIAGDSEDGESSQHQTLLGSYLALAALLLMIAQAALSMELTRRKQQRNTPIRTGYGVGVNSE